METTIATATLNIARPAWYTSRLAARMVHLGCGAFHRAHQALFTHHLLETMASGLGVLRSQPDAGHRSALD